MYKYIKVLNGLVLRRYNIPDKYMEFYSTYDNKWLHSFSDLDTDSTKLGIELTEKEAKLQFPEVFEPYVFKHHQI